MMRKLRTLALTIAAAAGVAAASAQSASDIVDRVLAAYKTSGGVEATYTVKSPQGTTAGTIAMSGDKFRILSDDMKSWYDGGTLWTYSTMTGEVNITSPDRGELLTISPLIALSELKAASQMSLKTQGGSFIVTFTPQDGGPVAGAAVTVASSGYQVEKAVFTMSDGSSFTTTITGYATGKNFAVSTFVYDSSLVPAGTETVDLR